jgi:hypothetical protein
MRPERAIVRHWQLVMLAFTFSLLVGALPEGTVPVGVVPKPDAPAAAADDTETPGHVSAGGKIRISQHSNGRRRAHRVQRDVAAGTRVVVPVGSAAALLGALVNRRSAARVGRSLPLEAPT